MSIQSGFEKNILANKKEAIMKNSIAVISVDMHRGHLDPEVATLPLLPAERCHVVIKNTARLFEKLREKKIPIIHIVTTYRNPDETLTNPFWRSKHDDPSTTRKGIGNHNLAGAPGTQIIPELYNNGDYIVNTKKRYNCFYQTDLEFVLRSLAVNTVIITGINTSSCCLNTGFEATNRDFKVYMVEDCMDSMDGRDFHEAALKIMRQIIGEVVTAEELLATL